MHVSLLISHTTVIVMLHVERVSEADGSNDGVAGNRKQPSGHSQYFNI